MAKIQNSDNNEYWQECEAAETHIHCVEMQNSIDTLKDSLAVS